MQQTSSQATCRTTRSCELGRGAEATSYEVRGTDDGASYVARRISLDHIKDWSAIDAAARELDALEGLEHQGIPKLIEHIRDDEGMTIIRELAPGRSLQEIIDASASMSVEQLERIATQLLEILEYLGERVPPLIHRDIKPANIIDDGVQARLIDFGAARLFAMDRTVTSMGTFGFMSPEQQIGRPAPESDMYSLGVTLFVLATRLQSHQLPLDPNTAELDVTAMDHIGGPLKTVTEGMTRRGLAARLGDPAEALRLLRASEASVSAMAHTEGALELERSVEEPPSLKEILKQRRREQAEHPEVAQEKPRASSSGEDDDSDSIRWGPMLMVFGFVIAIPIGVPLLTHIESKGYPVSFVDGYPSFQDYALTTAETLAAEHPGARIEQTERDKYQVSWREGEDSFVWSASSYRTYTMKIGLELEPERLDAWVKAGVMADERASGYLTLNRLSESRTEYSKSLEPTGKYMKPKPPERAYITEGAFLPATHAVVYDALDDPTRAQLSRVLKERGVDWMSVTFGPNDEHGPELELDVRGRHLRMTLYPKDEALKISSSFEALAKSLAGH